MFMWKNFYLQYPLFWIDIVNGLKSTIACVGIFANCQEMNITMTDPWNCFISDVLHSTFEICCFSNENCEILKNCVIEVWTDNGSLHICCVINIEMINNVVIVVVVIFQVAFIIELITHQFIMFLVGIKCRWYSWKKREKMMKYRWEVTEGLG